MFKNYITQSLLIIFEIILIPGLITLWSNSWSNINNFNECLTRFLTFTAIYEFLVYLISKNQLDARKDSLLICKTLFKQTLLLIDNPNIIDLKKDILEKINALNDTSYYFIHKDILDAINILKSAIEDNKIYSMKDYLKCELILIEHKIEVEDLKWNNTLILKFFKCYRKEYIMNCSDIINIISIVINSLLAIVAIFISVKTLKQSSKAIIESSRGYIVFYIDTPLGGNQYLVLKNFGHSSATLKSINIIPEITYSKSSIDSNNKLITEFSNILLEPPV